MRPSERRETEQTHDDHETAEPALTKAEVDDRVHDEHDQRRSPPVPSAAENTADEGDGRNAEPQEHACDVAHVHRPEPAPRQVFVVDVLEEHRDQCAGRDQEREPPLGLAHMVDDVEADHIGRDQAQRAPKSGPRELARSSNGTHFLPPAGCFVRLVLSAPFQRNTHILQ
jgi:hypothetical protein